MDLTRRGRGIAALAALLAVGAAVLERPLLLAGTVGVAAWLLARQARFGADVAATVEALSVEQRPSREVAVADDPVRATLAVELDRPAPLALTVEARPPVASAGVPADRRRVALERGDRTAEATFPVTFPVAGRHAFREPTASVGDPDGLFAADVASGTTPTVTVEPRTPGEIHVGRGGEQVAGVFGEYGTDRRGPGLEPEELRTYVVGDPADAIDWKATARLAEPHVREYRVETDLRVALVVDHRASTATGREGRRVLDYARQVALSYLASLRQDGTAVGLYGVGDDGITLREPPDATDVHYARLRTRLHDLSPTAAEVDRRPQSGGQDGRGHPARTPDAARRGADCLADDDSRFGRTLYPLLADAAPYAERVAGDPLYATVRSAVGSLRGSVVTVLVTDGERPAEVREAVRLARRGDDRVVVLVLPQVLYEPGGLADLDAAYERYLAFEAFRRGLAGLDRVSAFEVAPADRLEAVLSARREVSR